MEVVSSNPSEVALLIEGERFRFWESIRISRSIDSIDKVEFSAPFEASNPSFKEKFRPFSYKKVSVFIGGRLLFNGVMVAVTPNITTEKKSVAISCYSIPGVLGDCTMPSSAYPLEFNNSKLDTIAKKLCAPFGIKPVFTAGIGASFERVALDPGQNILAFLTDLAKFRNMIISSTSDGKLLFQKSASSGKPVVRLFQGEPPIIEISPTFNPQEYYSHITGIEPATTKHSGSQFTVKNPKLNGVLRPDTFRVENTKKADVKEAVNAKLGRMFGNMVSYSISLATWFDPSGNLWEPNTTLKLKADDAMIYSEYEFIVRSVEFSKEADKETASMTLVLPGAFSGEIPKALPWD